MSSQKVHKKFTFHFSPISSVILPVYSIGYLPFRALIFQPVFLTWGGGADTVPALRILPTGAGSQDASEVQRCFLKNYFLGRKRRCY